MTGKSLVTLESKPQTPHHSSLRTEVGYRESYTNSLVTRSQREISQSKICAFVFFLCLCLPYAVLSANQTTELKAAELHRLREKITSIEQELSHTEAAAGTLQSQLRDSELTINRATLTLRNMGLAIEKLRVSLDRLTTKQAQKLTELQQQQARLKDQIVANYILGRSDYIKLLLNQQSPTRVGRALTYHSYYTKARVHYIADADKTLRDVQRLQQVTRRQTTKLRGLQAKQSQELRQLQEEQRQRQVILAKLERQIHNQGTELRQLKDDERRLDKLVRSLQALVKEQPTFEPLNKSFRALKGQLNWPLAGKIITHYGGKRGEGPLQWQGVVIQNEGDNTVIAVAGGQVVFADWFKNMGMLIIIDHGDGYMTLYGHNQSLYKSPGDVVESGESLASVGGRLDNLYFEIRHDGVPQNPSHWCRY